MEHAGELVGDLEPGGQRVSLTRDRGMGRWNPACAVNGWAVSLQPVLSPALSVVEGIDEEMGSGPCWGPLPHPNLLPAIIGVLRADCEPSE